jgi:hypothetical protein
VSTANDALDLGLLLAWASRPRETPARHDDYHRVVMRYRQDPDFAMAADAMFTGAGLQVIVDERDGVIVTAEADSPLRLTLSDIMKRSQPHHRAVIGAVLLAIARIAYPEPYMVDDPDRIAVFTTQSVVDTLDRVAQAQADTSEEDAELDDVRVEMWRQWLALASARPNARRRSVNDRPGAVTRVCKVLVEAGYLTAHGSTDGGTWMVRPRFRHAVAALCADTDLYALVNGLADGQAAGGQAAGGQAAGGQAGERGESSTEPANTDDPATDRPKR